MAPWENGEVKYSYNRPNKRRFDEIQNTIENLRHELFLNDIVLMSEVEKRVHSNYDRELMEAELYTQRLAALTEASRSQIWRVQSGALTSGDFHLDYDSWDPKRKRPNYKEEIPSYDYSNQYAATTNWHGQMQTNNWTGYNHPNNNNYNYNYNQAQKPYRPKKRKNKGPVVSMNRCKINKPATAKNITPLLPTPKQSVGLLPTPNIAVKPTSAPTQNTVAPKSTKSTTAKPASKTNTNVSTAKTNASVKPVSTGKTNVPVKPSVSAAKTNASEKPSVSAAKTNVSGKPSITAAKTNVPVKLNVSAANTDVPVKPIASSGQTEIKPIPTIISAPTTRPILPIRPLRPLKQETIDMIKANESSRNLPSLFSLDMSSIRLQFAPSDRIFIKSENFPSEQLLSSNGTVTVKTENPDSMVDDLADHI